MFGSEAWVPVTSLGACNQSVCLEEYQLPVELDTKICLSFSCSSVQYWESLGLFGLIVHSTAHLPVYTVHAQDFKDFSSLFLHTCLPPSEDGKGTIFGLAESYMSVLTEVISECDEVPVSLYGGILDWTTYVTKYSSEYFSCLILR